jgi:hypothetical protein
MERSEMLELWTDMWKEGNWVPSWPDSLAGLSTQDAAWKPDANSHSIWQEVVHTIFWRRVTLNIMGGGKSPTDEEVEHGEFAAPDNPTDAAWSSTVHELEKTQTAIADAIQDDSKDVSRVPYHILHDAYHLGRITQLRRMQGTEPKF